MMISAETLTGRLIPAVPVPFRGSGKICLTALEGYAEWMTSQPIGGVAVWAHTGRGLRLSESIGDRVLTTWRRILTDDHYLIAAAGARGTHLDSSEVIESARAMAQRALDLGADAILVHPPLAFRDSDDRDRLILDYHTTIADVGLPLILFYLYEAAGGVSYSPDLLRSLLGLPRVLGIKVATLDSVMTFQDISGLIREVSPGKLLITGEDRFLGYSLMCGAKAALIGMGAACTDLQGELLNAYWNGRTDRFLTMSSATDDLALHTFRAPMEGYIQRMLWCLVHQGVIPLDAAFDPWAPDLDPAEFDQIGKCLERLSRLR